MKYNSTSLFINGEKAYIGEFGDGFSKKYSIKKGMNIFRFEAVDAAGNTSDRMLRVNGVK